LQADYDRLREAHVQEELRRRINTVNDSEINNAMNAVLEQFSMTINDQESVSSFIVNLLI
jgi:hypothetical protein